VLSNLVYLNNIETNNLISNLFCPSLSITFQIDKFHLLLFNETYFNYTNGEYVDLKMYKNRLKSINWYLKFSYLDLKFKSYR